MRESSSRAMSMEEMFQRLLTQALRAKLELCRIVAAALMEEMDLQQGSGTRQRTAFRSWAEVTRDGDMLEFMLELLRRHDRELARGA